MRLSFGCSLANGEVDSSVFARLTWSLVALVVWLGAGAGIHAASASPTSDLLSVKNLIPWEVQWVQGGKAIEPEARARILRSKGIQRFAVIYSPSEAAQFEAQIAAYRREDVKLAAVFLWLDADLPGKDARVRAAFESFKRLGIRPTVWISQSSAFLPKTIEEWKQRLAEAGFHRAPGYDLLDIVQASFSSRNDLTEQEKEEYFKALHRVHADTAHLPKTPQEQAERLARETRRVESLARLASRYDLEVALYNHNGWFGMMDNQLAIIERLEKVGVSNVGIVYTFWHARDSLHDDVKVFEQVWTRIKPHVTTLAISGVRGEMESLYPSEGDDEVSMMRIVKESGWNGPVGVLCSDYGVAPETVLSNMLRGIDWLAAELNEPGSGGERPIFRQTGGGGGRH